MEQLRLRTPPSEQHPFHPSTCIRMTASTSFRRLISAYALILISTIAAAQTKVSCSFKVFQLPESTSSVDYGVNDYGTVVGAAACGPTTTHGFMRTAGGAVTYFSAPQTGACTSYSGFTAFADINNAGVKVGTYKVSGMSDPEGFLLNGSTFTPIKEPKSVWGTSANAINKWNTVVGSYLDNAFHSHGFKRSSNGSFLTLDFPAAQGTSLQGINDNGVIVGFYYPGHGFIYHSGSWATLNYPGASSTELNGVSDANVIIGNSNATKQGTAFLYENGVFKVIVVPNTYSTSVSGISAKGLIVGRTNLDNTQAGWRGFTATCQ